MAHLLALVLDSAAKWGTEFKVMQELLRHSSLRSTLEIYTQAVMPARHAAQAAVLSLVFASNVNGGARSSDSDALRQWQHRVAEGKKGAKRAQNASFSRPRWFYGNWANCFGMNGGLEPAASAVTGINET